MKVTYDPAKREAALKDRGLDFEDAEQVFAGPVFEFEDTRKAYGERRMICYGVLGGRLLVVGYVERGSTRHVFSIRKANEREITRYQERLE